MDAQSTFVELTNVTQAQPEATSSKLKGSKRSSSSSLVELFRESLIAHLFPANDHLPGVRNEIN
jgi:hypothetical protein